MASNTASALLRTFTATATAGIDFTTAFSPLETARTLRAASILDPSHPDPTAFNSHNPLVLFIIQVFVIVGSARILNIPLAKLRQPRVISEVLGGIVLGPTAFGRIPGFTDHIFPETSLPFLNLVSELGLVLFLFLVGLEVDFALFRKNMRVSLGVAGVGTLIPFALGTAVSVGLFNEFVGEGIKFEHFLLFIGTSMSITAFPVLARILTELDLLRDRVGVVVLSAGVANDVIGWILLALTIALVNAGSGLIVLYIFLCTMGWALVLFFIIRPLFRWAARKSGSLDGNGPTQSIVCLSLMLVLMSAWVTDQIGVNAIFGGFMAGLILPHDHGFAGHLTEKIEDLVVTLFVPIYFALSGLRTNLGLLNNGITWAWAICVIVVAFSGKFIGAAAMAKINGYSYRESGAVGALMSCKGLIELIVLNIGFTAGIITDRVFAIFILEALTLTILTTPLTLAFYPPHLRTPAAVAGTASKLSGGSGEQVSTDGKNRSKFLIVLEDIDNFSAVMVFTRLLASPPKYSSDDPTSIASIQSPTIDSYTEKPAATSPPTDNAQEGISIDVVRLVELTDRTSAVMQASETAEKLRRDPLSTLFSTFASLNGLPITSSSLAVIPYVSFTETVVARAHVVSSDFVLVPWNLGKTPVEESGVASRIPNPFEALFDRAGEIHDSPQYTSFVRQLFAEANTDVGLFIDRGLHHATSPATKVGHAHLFLPFHGGADDRTCLDFILQLVKRHRGITATVVQFTRAPEPTDEDQTSKIESKLSSSTTSPDAPALQPVQLTVDSRTGRAGDTLYLTQHHGLASETADEISLEQARTTVAEQRLSISIEACHTAFPLRSSISRAHFTAAATESRFISVVGRGRRDAASHRVESAELLASHASKLGFPSLMVRTSLGEVGTALFVSDVSNNMLVIQSRATGGVRQREV